MRWLDEAEAEIRKAPFFVRKKARQRVEAQVAAEGREVVTPDDVRAAKKRFLDRMEDEVKGFQVEACFGPQGCPNRAVAEDLALAGRIEEMLEKEDLREFLKSFVGERLKFHHEFRVALADCPNACSQPQIRDIGIIGAAEPEAVGIECSQCAACVDVCREGAVTLDADMADGPVFEKRACLMCGQCIKECPTGTIACARRGYRLLIGGKLGRHPRLAREVPGVHDAETILHLIKWCVDYYKKHSTRGERFAVLAAKAGPELIERVAAEASSFTGGTFRR
jgi:dissimilatory sulfite reductase (desulfoviridin) alpha/beta subunit